jgi:DNA-binding XRE family transcriptional regulator
MIHICLGCAIIKNQILFGILIVGLLVINISAVFALETTSNQTIGSDISDTKSKSTTTFSQAEVIESAKTVKKYTEDYKRLPSKVQMGTTQVNMAQFLHLSTATVLSISKHNTKNLVLTEDDLPLYSYEHITEGNLSQSEYVQLSNNISNKMDYSHKAPPNANISLGKIGFQSLTYLYARILTSYQYKGSLPSVIPLKNWTYYSTVKFSTSQVINAAENTKDYIETKKTLPTQINIGKQQINMAQLLHLMTSTVININKKNTKSITLLKLKLSTNQLEKLNSGQLNKTEYLNLSQQIILDLGNNSTAPQYMDSRLGKIGFPSLIYMYTRILSSYEKNNQLPVQIYMKTWNANTIPINNKPITFLPQQVLNSAVVLKNSLETSKTLPTRVRIGYEFVNTSQFLHLMSSTLIQIKENKLQPLVLYYDKLLTGSQENMISGKIEMSNYLDFSYKIQTYFNIYHKNPTFNAVGIGFESQLYLLSSVLQHYQKQKLLPNTLWLKSLKPVVLLGSNNLGKVERLGPYGNISSSVKIAYIIGMHPLESMSHKTMLDAIKTNSNTLKYCYYVYKITVTLNANDYEKSRLNGQLLGQKFVTSDLINHKYNLTVDVHSNRGNWAQKRFVFCPVSGTTGQTISHYLVNKISWLHYYKPPNPTSPNYVVIPAIKGGIPSFCYEIYITDNYETSLKEQNLFLKTLDAMKFKN